MEAFPSLPEVTWDRSKAFFTFDDHRFHLSSLCHLLQDQLACALTVLKQDVLLGFPLDSLMPSFAKCTDNLSLTAERYSLLLDSANPFLAARNNLARAILEHPELSVEFGRANLGGGVAWDRPRVKRWRDAVHRVKSHLLVAILLGDPLAVPEQELLQTLHSNTLTRQRNIQSPLSNLVCILGQFKGHLLGRAISSSALQILLPLLVLVNPFEADLVASLQGSVAAEPYSSLLFVSIQGVWTVEMLNDMLRDATGRVFGYPLSLSQWHHVAKSAIQTLVGPSTPISQCLHDTLHGLTRKTLPQIDMDFLMVSVFPFLLFISLHPFAAQYCLA